MSCSTRYLIDLGSDKSLILFIREGDRLVFRVDVLEDGQLVFTNQKPYGISVEETIQNYR